MTSAKIPGSTETRTFDDRGQMIAQTGRVASCSYTFASATPSGRLTCNSTLAVVEGRSIMCKLSVCFYFFSVVATAQSYCALEVEVRSPQGRAIPRVGVAITRDQRTAVKETETSESGIARFCDMPFGPMDVVVGNAGCGQVGIRRVETRWPRTTKVLAVYDDSYCVSGLSATTCQIQIRLQDEAGKPLPHVRFKTPATVGGALQSDGYGRIFLVTQPGQTLAGLLELPGWEAVPVTYRCSDYISETITMRPSRKD